MFIAGVDLAAQAKGTALAVIDWSANSGRVVDLRLGVDDGRILDAANKVEKLGIDCALGWPIEFIEFLNNQHSPNPNESNPLFDGGIESRRRLAYRETDRQVREITGRWPLSVSTDRLGMTAIRCAGLLSKLQASGIPVDRSGGAKVVEVYPGASLRLWGFDTAGYRNSAEIRARLIADIHSVAGWFDLGDFQSLMIESCDALDAVIAALAASSAHLGAYVRPQPNQLTQATAEGWVALPTGPLQELLTRFEA